MFLNHATQKPLLVLVFAAASLFAMPSCTENSGTWKDPKTGLKWQRCSLGQTWNGHECDGQAKEYTFDEAQEAVKDLGRGWRVPAASELTSLIRCNTGFVKTIQLPDSNGGMKTMSHICNGDLPKPTIDSKIFPNTPARAYWSASSYAKNDNGAWGVGFYYGDSYSYDKRDNFHVRAVRGGN